MSRPRPRRVRDRPPGELREVPREEALRYRVEHVREEPRRQEEAPTEGETEIDDVGDRESGAKRDPVPDGDAEERERHACGHQHEGESQPLAAAEGNRHEEAGNEDDQTRRGDREQHRRHDGPGEAHRDRRGQNAFER